MLIKSVDIYSCKLELKKPFITSLGSSKKSDHIFIKVLLKDGTFGWGECAPSNTINGENINTCLALAPSLCRSIIGLDVFNHEEINLRLDSIIYGNNSIKSAIDIACYDASSKNMGKPLYKYLGASVKKKLHTDFTVSLDSIEKMSNEALILKNKGFKIIKVKVGGDAEIDIDRIKSIRKAVGNEIELFIDANQGWSINNALKVLNRIKPFNIKYCEAPINKELSHKLSYIKKNSPIKIMADESLFNSNDALKLIDGNHCDYFNIKIGKTGGIHEALKIISIGEKNNIMMQVGGFIETKIVFTVNCHLAYLSKNIKFFDCDSPLFHKKDPIIGGLVYQKNWEMKIPEKSGLSVDVKKDYLKNPIKIN